MSKFPDRLLESALTYALCEGLGSAMLWLVLRASLH